MAPLLYLCVRPERDAADAEHESFRRGLGTGDLDRFDLLDAPLDADVLGRYRGVVVGGSPFNVTTTAKSALQRRVEDDLGRAAEAALGGGPAVFFTCYGIGVVTRLLGGEVTTSHPEPTSAVTIARTAQAESDPVFGPAPSHFSVLTAHKEGARTAPPGTVLLAEGAACPVQAYRAGDRLYATQFHPEPSPRDFANRMAFYRESGYFDAAAFDAVRERVLAARVTEGAALLRRFATTFA